MSSRGRRLDLGSRVRARVRAPSGTNMAAAGKVAGWVARV